MCIFGLFVLVGMLYQYFAAQRRTQLGLAEIVKVKPIASGSIARLLSPFEITYRFNVENETITTSNHYDVEPTGPSIAVVYERAKPRNNALMLPSKDKRGISMIAAALIIGGGWLIKRNIHSKKRRPESALP
jgi:hypothetical protein